MWEKIRSYFMPIFVSPTDEMLHDFDEAHPGYSPSQTKERDKYERIHDLRGKA